MVPRIGSGDRLVPLLEAVHERLAGVWIDCLGWEAFIQRWDRPKTLFYLDPPDWGTEHCFGRGWFGRSDFERLSAALQRLQGRFILPLNDVPEVRELFAWASIETVELSYPAGGAEQTKRVRKVVISGKIVVNIPNWATLRVLGQSSAMRLTILVPLLGSLLLFNNEIVGWAKLSEAAVRSWLHVPAEQKEEVALQYTISRLQMLYLGLTVLGIAAALFNGLCPPEIKSHGSNREYQEAELPTMTRARTAMLLVKMGIPPTEGDLGKNWLLVSSELTNQNADPTLIASAIREASFPALERIARDLLSLHYDTLLESKKAGRAVITGAYCIGFILLLWPTGATFARIVWSIRPWA